MKITDILAIDVHAHYGYCDSPTITELERQLMTGDAATVVARAKEAMTELTIASPLLGLFPRGQADAVAGNEEAHNVIDETEGLLQWVIINPLQEATFVQAREMLKHPKCVGIKIHPEEHQYPIRDYGRILYEAAEENGAVILTHSGDTLSDPMEFVSLANDFPTVRAILAHIGNGGYAGGDPRGQVQAAQNTKHGNLYADTSSARSIMPGLIEWAVSELGAGRILYGTDTPLYFAPMQRARIDHADISNKKKLQILRSNAIELLSLQPLVASQS
ncbi:MAG: amidohydrolase family protein [Planctomycetota bacterium]|jgi:predicted TIM-barrel fold metal-dependent hydrolase|nr:amidohydrolase family protein [Planctomycetota bacterium]